MSNKRNSLPPNRWHKWRSWGAILALATVLIVLAAVIMVGGPHLLDPIIGPKPAAGLSAANRALAQSRLALEQSAEKQLNSSGWVDEAAGVAHIPINQAIALVAENQLPVGSAGANSAADSSETAVDLSNVNYTDDILPIFTEHCAECHGDDDPEEGLLLTSYKGVMAGSNYGAVVKPGDPEDSYLVEMVRTGKMPKRGPKLSAEEIATIVAWIEAGAPEQGADPAGTATNATDAAAAVDLANVSFQKDVLPIFTDRCSECHGDDEPEEGLVLTSYKDVMAGSIYGAVVKPGAPDDSYLVEMVSTGKMPKRGADLTKAQVETIVAWIAAGAPDN